MSNIVKSPCDFTFSLRIQLSSQKCFKECELCIFLQKTTEVGVLKQSKDLQFPIPTVNRSPAAAPTSSP